MSGTKENDYSTGFVNGIADGKPHFNAIKPKSIYNAHLCNLCNFTAFRLFINMLLTLLETFGYMALNTRCISMECST